MGDISDIERKDKDPASVNHIKNIIKIGHNKLSRKTTICVNKAIEETQSMEASHPSNTQLSTSCNKLTGQTSSYPPHHHHYITPSPTRATSVSHPHQEHEHH